MMTISLDALEELEYHAVHLLTLYLLPSDRARLEKSLADLRIAKRRLLAANPSILRKVRTEPTERDQPNAPMPQPDAGLGSNNLELLHFRAPESLRDISSIHLNTGHQMNIPPSGIVEINPRHSAVIAEIKARGFRQMRPIDKFGKTLDGSDPAAAFHRDRLRVIGGPNLLQDLADRARKASTVPCEMRVEAHDGPQPAATFAGSLAAFRRKYFGEE
jgi:hypothetical protein